MFSLVNKKNNNSNVSQMLSNAIKSQAQQKSCPTCPGGTTTTTTTTTCLSGNSVTCSLGSGTSNSCVVNTLPNSTSVSNCPDGTKYEIKVKNKPGPTGPTGPPGPKGVLSEKLNKFENYLYEVPNSDEVYTIGLQSQVNQVHSILADPSDNYTINYLNSNTVWLYTNSTGGTGPYNITIRNVPDTSSNDNKLTIYMPTTSTNLLTNYVDSFIINDISYDIYWENGLRPDLIFNELPSIVKQECNILPHFGGGQYMLSSRVSYFNSAPDKEIYYVKVVLNVLSQPVYAISTSLYGTYERQKVISFVAGKDYTFDFSDPSNYFDSTPLSPVTYLRETKMVFGTIADNKYSIQNFASYNGTPGQTGAQVLLKVPRGYSGDPLMYFDKNIANMGYQIITQNQLSSIAKLTKNITTGAREIDINIDASANFPIGSKVVVGVGLYTQEEFVVQRYGSIFLGTYDNFGVIQDATTKYNHYKNETITGSRTIDFSYNVVVQNDVLNIDICNNGVPVFYNQFLDFQANKNYLFIQSDPSNKGNTIVFSPQSDVISSVFKDYLRPHGTPGTTGAYTLVTVPMDVSNIAYFSAENKYLGFGNAEIDVSSSNVYTKKTFGVNVINRTGTPVDYVITGDFGPVSLGNIDMSGTLSDIFTTLYYYIDADIVQPGDFIFSVSYANADISVNLLVENAYDLSVSKTLAYNGDVIDISATNNLEVSSPYTLTYNTITANDFNIVTNGGTIPPNDSVDISFVPQLTTSVSGDVTVTIGSYEETIQVYKQRYDVSSNVSAVDISAGLFYIYAGNYTASDISYSIDLCGNLTQQSISGLPLVGDVSGGFQTSTFTFPLVDNVNSDLSGSFIFSFGNSPYDVSVNVQISS